MNIAEKKAGIINALQHNNDEQLIDEVYELLHTDETVEKINLDELPSELQNKLTKALEDYHIGRYITHKQIQQKIQQWPA
ncbi:MAG: hypothetical protein ABI921_14915 [Panacibacter sp.]